MEDLKQSESLDEGQHSIGAGSDGALLFDEELFSVFDDEDDQFLQGKQQGVSWHNEDLDKPHRQSVIQEIARLLQARKKAVPSPEWMLQLPHKARKLEARLYRSAGSLDDYLDRSTLKLRLQKLAKSIVREYTGQSKSAKKKLRTPQQQSDPSRSLSLPPSHGGAATLPMGSVQIAESSLPASRNSSISSKNSITEIERQKAVNARLQEEIMDNIRRQQALVLRLQTNPGDASSNSSLNGNPQLNAALPTSLTSSVSLPPMPGAVMHPSDHLSEMIRRQSFQQLNDEMLRRHSGSFQFNNLMTEAMLQDHLQQPTQQRMSLGGVVGLGAHPGMFDLTTGLGGATHPTIHALHQQQQLQLLRNSILSVGGNSSVLEAMQAARQSPQNNNGNSSNTAFPGDAPLSPNSFNW